MIGTIRKHSKWLWWVIAALTIISFIGWNIAPASRNQGYTGSGFGKLYGHDITQLEYVTARNEFYLFYWFRNHGEWPDRNPNIKQKDMEEQIYLRMMLEQKAETMGIQVGDDAAAAAASEMLRSIGRNGQAVQLDSFVKQVLGPEGMTAVDFEHFVRSDLVIQQLVKTMGMVGSLITPQEAAAAYQRDHQEISAQVVFLSASNFLSQISVTPAAITQFYTNYLAQYRLPDRVQVSYVEFNLSNYLAQSKAEWAKTNLEEVVNATFVQYGMNAFEAKTPDEAKGKIRETLIQQRALASARAQANKFAKAVFDQKPLPADSLATVAKQEGFTVHLTAPFSMAYGPEEFMAPQTFTKSAFALTADDPVAGPVHGPVADYVIALQKQLPSEIPPLDQISDRVTQDYRMVQAAMLAVRTGTNFAPALASQMMSGHNFASACVAAGLLPETLPAFSLSTQELPELGSHVELNQFLRVVANMPTGRLSPFIESGDGGFMVYVQSRQPVDPAAMKADLPLFTAELRRERETEAFNQWVQAEANRQLRDTPVFAQKTATAAK